MREPELEVVEVAAAEAAVRGEVHWSCRTMFRTIPLHPRPRRNQKARAKSRGQTRDTLGTIKEKEILHIQFPKTRISCSRIYLVGNGSGGSLASPTDCDLFIAVRTAVKLLITVQTFRSTTFQSPKVAIELTAAFNATICQFVKTILRSMSITDLYLHGRYLNPKSRTRFGRRRRK